MMGIKRLALGGRMMYNLVIDEKSTVLGEFRNAEARVILKHQGGLLEE